MLAMLGLDSTCGHPPTMQIADPRQNLSCQYKRGHKQAGPPLAGWPSQGCPQMLSDSRGLKHGIHAHCDPADLASCRLDSALTGLSPSPAHHITLQTWVTSPLSPLTSLSFWMCRLCCAQKSSTAQRAEYHKPVRLAS